jgi:hypothetical protein
MDRAVELIHRGPTQSGPKQKYILSTLLAMTLACNANAKDKDGTTYSVPDAGPTAALLGLSVALLVFAQRKVAIVK